MENKRKLPYFLVLHHLLTSLDSTLFYSRFLIPGLRLYWYGTGMVPYQPVPTPTVL